MKIPSMVDHEMRHYRFSRTLSEFKPLEDWTPTHRTADRIVFAVACVLWFILLFVL